MNTTIFIVMLLSLQLVYWFIGLRTNKPLDGTDDYFLAGKSVSLFPLMMTFLATQVGGGVILGAAEEAYHFGWFVLFYPLGSALGLILLGCGIGSRLSTFQVSTIAQIVEVAYGSKALRQIAALLSIVSLFMILVAQIIASNKFLFSLGCNSILLSAVFWGVIIFYTAKGGLRAVISTDLVQAAFFSFVFLFCFGFVLYYEPGIARLEMPHATEFANVSAKLSGWLLMPLLFMVIEQDMGQRCFAGASPKIVSRAAFFAGLSTMTICVVPVFFGHLAQVTGFEVAPGASVLIGIIAKLTNPWCTALVGCAILAAIISTATSLINAISSNVANDFFNVSALKNQSLKTVQWITTFIAIAALYCAFYLDNVLEVLIQSYELSVSCLFIPVWMALFQKERGVWSAFLAMLFGGLSFIFFHFYPVSFPKEIASIALSLLGFYLGAKIKLKESIGAYSID